MCDMTTKAEPTALEDIRVRMVRLKNLLRAADQLGNAFSTHEAAPLFAVLDVAVSEAQQLDSIIDEMWERVGNPLA